MSSHGPVAAYRRSYLVLFALGASLGTLLDFLHVASHTTRYAGTDGQPLWVPLLFGAGAVVLGAGRLAAFRALGLGPRPATAGQALFALGAFAVAYAISAYAAPAWALGLLVLLGAALLLGIDRSLAGGAAGLGAMIAGPLFESALIAAGTFRYEGAPGPDFVLGVPHWLPFLYLSASVAVGAVARWHARV